MEQEKSSALRLLSRTSTPIENRIRENLAAGDWKTCVRCGQEYRPFVLREGHCDLCLIEIDRIRSVMSEVFNGRQKLIQMASDDFKITDGNNRAYIAARDFDPMKQNLYLFGSVGTGKTHLAAKIVRRAVAKKLGCAFVIAEEWLRSLYGVNGQDQQAAIIRLAKTRVLVIDELGFEPSTEFSLRSLYDVVNARVLDDRAGLVVTSNLSLDQLAGRLSDDRLTSRLAGMCSVVEIRGEDFRQRGEG